MVRFSSGLIGLFISLGKEKKWDAANLQIRAAKDLHLTKRNCCGGGCLGEWHPRESEALMGSDIGWDGYVMYMMENA